MSNRLMKAPREHRRIIFRDVLIFQLKLFLDGVKDVILSPLSIIAAIADVVAPTDRVGKRFYHVMLVGERLDKWLNLFGAAEHADPGEDGLFGASRAGSNSMLGRLETIVTGREETEPAKREDFDDHPLDWDRNAKAMNEFDRELERHRGKVKDPVPGEFEPDDLNHDVFGQPDP